MRKAEQIVGEGVDITPVILETLLDVLRQSLHKSLDMTRTNLGLR